MLAASCGRAGSVGPAEMGTCPSTKNDPKWRTCVHVRAHPRRCRPGPQSQDRRLWRGDSATHWPRHMSAPQGKPLGECNLLLLTQQPVEQGPGLPRSLCRSQVSHSCTSGAPNTPVYETALPAARPPSGTRHSRHVGVKVLEQRLDAVQEEHLPWGRATEGPKPGRSRRGNARHKAHTSC